MLFNKWKTLSRRKAKDIETQLDTRKDWDTRLPVELVWIIFGLAWGGTNDPVEVKTFFAITVVCREWREVALAHSTIKRGTLNVSNPNLWIIRKWTSSLNRKRPSIEIDDRVRLQRKDGSDGHRQLQILMPLPPFQIVIPVVGNTLASLEVHKTNPATRESVYSFLWILNSIPNLKELRLHEPFSLSDDQHLELRVSLPKLKVWHLTNVHPHHAALLCRHLKVDWGVLSSIEFMTPARENGPVELSKWTRGLSKQLELPPDHDLWIVVDRRIIRIRVGDIQTGLQTIKFNFGQDMCFNTVLTGLPLDRLVSLKIGPFDDINCRRNIRDRTNPFGPQPTFDSLITFLRSGLAPNLRQLIIFKLCSHQLYEMEALLKALPVMNYKCQGSCELVFEACSLLQQDYDRFISIGLRVIDDVRSTSMTWNGSFFSHLACYDLVKRISYGMSP